MKLLPWHRSRRQNATAVDLKGPAVGAAIGTGGALVGVGVSLAVPGPSGAVLGAIVSSAATAGLRVGLEYAQKQWGRVADVIDLAAKEADLTSEELAQRLQASSGREELFIRTMRAAADSASRRKLVALSKALASGALADASKVEWETIFVKVVDALDEPHLALLERFEESATHGGIGKTSLDMVGLRTMLPTFEDVLDSLVATLESEGLLSSEQPPVYGGAPKQWRLTSFGRTLLERLRDVGEPLN